jgi:hypothetical protein
MGGAGRGRTQIENMTRVGSFEDFLSVKGEAKLVLPQLAAKCS